MKRSTPVNLTQVLAWIAAAVLVLVPFHAFLTVWASSLVGHYTLLRLWKEFLLVLVLAGALYILATERQLRQRFLAFLPVRLAGVYIILMLLLGFVPLALHGVTGKAMWYGLLVDLRFLLFFLVVLIISSKSAILKSNWLRILLIPAILVAAFAILQYLVLPRDFLKHFGYGDKTISPYETINHNLGHLRVASTLRGANPLGAYLLLPVSALAALVLKERRRLSDKLMIGFGLLLALVFSFSRSAWIGAVISLSVLTHLAIRSQNLKRKLNVFLAILVLIIAGLALTLRHNTGFESVIYHTDHTATVNTSSDEGHRTAFKSAAHDIIHQPLGRGVGTAGPQSTYNYGHHGRIAENYFLQIGQEAGWLGVGLFIAISAEVGRELWRRRTETLALWLFASFIGITFINLLSHAWTDDTLAYLWWGLAAVALAPATGIARKSKDA